MDEGSTMLFGLRMGKGGRGGRGTKRRRRKD